MRALLPGAGTIAVLLIFDAAALGGWYWQAVWQEAQTSAQMFSYSINRMIEFAGPTR
jgi:hypothetical protein